MKLHLASFILLVATAIAGTSCTSAPEPTRGAASPTTEIVNGGELIIPIDADPATLNFVSGTDAYQALVARYVTDSLIDEGQDLSLVPRLARSWEFTDGGKQLTFHLRPSVTWHDGTPFTARDVLFTYQQIMDPANRARSELFREVEEVTAPDDLTVRVLYREPTVTAIRSWMISILPRHRFQDGPFAGSPAHQSPIGTGPFRFVRWSRGQELVMEANPDYFLGRPHLDRLVLKIIPSRATQFQALLTGDTDWSAVPPQEWDRRSGDDEFRRRFQLFRYPTLFLYYIAWNQRGPFFSDARVRLAMTLSMDREGFVHKVYLGAGSVAVSSFHPRQFGHHPELSPHPFDTTRAGRLLDEAGWRRESPGGVRKKDGKVFQFSLLIFQGSSDQQQMAALFQEQLGKLGIRVDLKILDWSALLDRLKGGRYDAVISGWALESDPDPTAFFHSDPRRGTSNYVGYENPELDQLMEEGLHAEEPARRTEIYQRVQEILHRDQPYTFLFFPLHSIAVDARFQGIQLSGSGLLRWYPALHAWHLPLEHQDRRGSGRATGP